MLSPISVIWWALAVLAVLIVLFLAVIVLIAIVKAIRSAFTKPTEKKDTHVIGGSK